jgi:ADP-heptose:LPS heptosyltransferase
VPGTRWVNLQYGECGDELAALAERSGLLVHHFDDLDLKDDFEGLAALVAALDGVVTAATAVSSVAGALGRPTWQLDSGSDWTLFGGDRSPWFPSLTAVRQAPGERDWGRVVAEIRAGIEG